MVPVVTVERQQLVSAQQPVPDLAGGGEQCAEPPGDLGIRRGDFALERLSVAVRPNHIENRLCGRLAERVCLNFLGTLEKFWRSKVCYVPSTT